jgi:hypothetical protein
MNELLLLQSHLEGLIVVQAIIDESIKLPRDVISETARSTWGIGHESAEKLGLDWRSL